MKCPVCAEKMGYKKLRSTHVECHKCLSKLEYHSDDYKFMAILSVQVFASFVFLRSHDAQEGEGRLFVLAIAALPIFLILYLMKKRQRISVIEKRDSHLPSDVSKV